MPPHFSPRPGRYGTHPVPAVSGIIGAANYLGGAAPLTVNNTTRFYLQFVSGSYYFLGASAQAGTKPADADGTVLATVKKIRGGVTVTSLTAALDLEALTNDVQSAFVLASGLSEADRTIIPGDILVVDVVNNSAAIDTQPAKLAFVAELGLKN